ncbi:[protein-PII] uridylyltransferase [Thalassotalea sediminis]|uniref:[protein-PII] uridylyltransferase n=1 Tax=Thalassotalea sediminis TaxID=1759089 RepID=UPI0025727908|nr:[protein-PII] uridylyltransferase [Thalassotalea sediminis]
MNFNTLPDALTLKSVIKEKDEGLNRRFMTDAIQELLTERAAFFDQLLTELWRFYGLSDTTISLNAVGGYGRASLHPGSDIDLAIIIDKKINKQQQEALSEFLTKLWDLGADIGHSVRTLDEAKKQAKHDVTIATNLLDIRNLAGPTHHATTIHDFMHSESIWSHQRFFEEKLAEQKARHVKAKNTALFLEPNLKNNPGGMRDVQSILWVAQKFYGLGYAEVFNGTKLLLTDEKIELKEAFDFVCRVRWALHTMAESSVEQLLFEYQADVAKMLGFGDGENSQQAIERMMRQLFRAMTRIRELNQLILDTLIIEHTPKSLGDKVKQLDSGFRRVGCLIDVEDRNLFIEKKQVIRMFRLISDIDAVTGITPKTLRALRNVRRSLLGELQDYQGCRDEFIELLSKTDGFEQALGLMHRYGILSVYFSHWQLIEGQMQFDMHNAYTVDEHAFKALAYLGAFEKYHEHDSLPVKAYQRLPDKLPLRLATLCHHLSGRQTDEDHELSAMQAKEFATFHQLDERSIQLVFWLVKNQTLMLDVCKQSDLNDPAIFQKVVKSISSQEKLDALLCFTVADLMATNESAWNPWIEYQLSLLYKGLKKVIAKGTGNVFEARTLISDKKAIAKSQLHRDIDITNVEKWWKKLPSEFFTANCVEHIVEITEKIINNWHEQHHVFLCQSNDLGFTTLVVYTPDRDQLFSDIFKVLSKAKLRVKEANMLTTEDDYVIEVFQLLSESDDVVDDEYRLNTVVDRVSEILDTGDTGKAIKAPMYVETFEQEPIIEVLSYPDKDKSLIKINALDDPGYIEQICQVFNEHGFTIHSAKISQLGECNDNVFLISNSDDQPLLNHTKEEIVKLIEDKISL